MSDAEDEFAYQCDLTDIPYSREFRFDPFRRWRADFMIPPNILVEIEGGVYQNGRHTRGAGYEKDCEKYNQATLLGFRLLRFTPGMVRDGAALETVRKAIG